MKKITKTNIMFTGMMLIYIIMIFVINLLPKGTLSNNMLAVIPEMIILLSAVLICLLLKSSALKDAEIGFVPISTCLKSVGLAYLCLPAIGLVNSITSLVNGNAAESVMEKINQNPLWLNVVLMALIPACVEEFIFRGIILGTYKKRNPFVGILLSAFLFGLLHLNINQMSYAFVLGVVLGFLTYATGSIIPSIVMHFTINANSIVLAYVSSKILDKVDGLDELLNGSASDAAQSTGMLDYIISGLTVLAIVAVATAFAVLLFANICKSNRGIKRVTAIVKKPMITTYLDEGKFLDGYLITGIAVGSMFIFYIDFIVKML